MHRGLVGVPQLAHSCTRCDELCCSIAAYTRVYACKYCPLPHRAACFCVLHACMVIARGLLPGAWTCRKSAHISAAARLAVAPLATATAAPGLPSESTAPTVELGEILGPGWEGLAVGLELNQPTEQLEQAGQAEAKAAPAAGQQQQGDGRPGPAQDASAGPSVVAVDAANATPAGRIDDSSGGVQGWAGDPEMAAAVLRPLNEAQERLVLT